MLILGFESSCDETAAAVLRVENNKMTVLSNVVSSQISIHALYGGVVPEIASRAHCEAITNVCREALEDANITLDDIDAISVTFAPGLIGSLLVGVSFAKSIAAVLNKPLVPVNHIEAHVAAAYIENEELAPPYLALVVSGGHTSLYNVRDYVTFDEIGCSRDDACGEAFDKVGRVMGLPYPGGAAMDKLAKEAFEKFDYTKKGALNFPSPAVNDDTFEYSFSGLKTAVINHIHNEKQKLKVDDLPYDTKVEIAGAFTKAVCDGIVKKLSSALVSTDTKTLVMAGGVAANSHLRKAVADVCAKHKVKFIVPSLSLCGDNAAMTAAAGYHSYNLGIVAGSDLNAFASDESAEDYLNNLKKNCKR
ncbi:MAG: tRNA (adenosine(37)-N6)-threonylcarbamoyltransferase complex transferase subunit TsaD [Ruminococcaceae bacterium]|nr:tRNA (adenosine(37)-N6)-threonylcarbamoyltransferase complex transferase subunit TsaD [Oscillospiraceae bacterium]